MGASREFGILLILTARLAQINLIYFRPQLQSTPSRSAKWLTQTNQFEEDLVVVGAGSSSSIWVDEIHHEEEVPRHPSAIAAALPKVSGLLLGFGSKFKTRKPTDFSHFPYEHV